MSFLNLSQNKEQIINGFYNFIGEFISVIIATIYYWSIPKLSLSSPLLFTLEFNNNIMTITPYDIVVLIFNFISIIFFMYLYYYEIKRELWLIKHFDYSKRYDTLHLNKYKTTYPQLFEILNPINSHYYLIYRIMKILCIINFLVSSSIILSLEFYDYKTATTLFLNSYLIYSKISKGLKVSRDSIEAEIGYSYYNTQSISFNRIDSKYKTHNSNSNFENSNIDDNSPNNSLENSLNNSINIPHDINKLFLSSTHNDTINTINTDANTIIDFSTSIET